MARELRVRSPIKARNNGPVAASSDKKRKQPDTEQMLRRSMRGQGPHSEFESNRTVSAVWKNPLFIVTGVPRDVIGRDGEDQDEVESDDDGQDSATWEEKWLGSPTKRRRLDRGFEKWPSNLDSPKGSRERRFLSNNVKPHAPVLQVPKPKAIERLSRSRAKSYSNASSPAQSRGVSREQSTRRSSMVPNDDAEQTPRDTPERSEVEDELESRSAKSSPPHTPSPALSSAASPEPPDQDMATDSGTAQQKDPDLVDADDLPAPFGDLPSPAPTESFEDTAAQLLSARFPPITLPQVFIKGLTSHHPSKRSTHTLKLFAENAQRALRIWQDEFIRLDKKTAPVSLPFPKKPALGGRVAVDDAAFEAEKTKDLYSEGSILAKAMGIVHPSQSKPRSTGTPISSSNGLAGGRELRRRRADAGVIDGLGISSDDAGAKTSKRMRKPVRRFDAGKNNTAADGATAKEMANGKAPVTRRRRGAGPRAADGQPQKAAAQKRSRLQDILQQERYDSASPMPGEAREPPMDLNVAGAFAKILAAQQAAEAARGQGKGRQTSTRGDGRTVQQNVRNGATLAPKGDGSNAYPHQNLPNGTGPGRSSNDQGEKGSAGAHSVREISPASKAAAAEKKARAKSEKRSESMTAWWAARKKKAAEEKIKEMRERGDYREGTWNVDTIKSWTPAGTGMLPPADHRQPGFWFDPRYGPSPWANPAYRGQMQNAAPPGPPNVPPNGMPAPFSYPSFVYPLATPEAHVDRWSIQQPIPQAQSMQPQQRRPSFAGSPPQPPHRHREAFSSGGALPDHPFAQRPNPPPQMPPPPSQYSSRPELLPPLRPPPAQPKSPNGNLTPFRTSFYGPPPTQPLQPPPSAAQQQQHQQHQQQQHQHQQHQQQQYQHHQQQQQHQRRPSYPSSSQSGKPFDGHPYLSYQPQGPPRQGYPSQQSPSPQQSHPAQQATQSQQPSLQQQLPPPPMIYQPPPKPASTVTRHRPFEL